MVQKATLKGFDYLRSQSEMTAQPDKYPQGRFNEKECRGCSKSFSPMAPSHLYCSDQCKKDERANKYFLQKYGIPFKGVEDLFKKQEGVCAICKEVGFKMIPTLTYDLCVDHCHTTGKVRGLLCPNCNRALGLFKDNVERLKSAIRYLSSE